MDGTHILVLKLQLITFDLFRDYKSFVSAGPQPCVYLLLQARLLAGRRGFEAKIRAWIEHSFTQ